MVGGFTRDFLNKSAVAVAVTLAIGVPGFFLGGPEAIWDRFQEWRPPKCPQSDRLTIAITEFAADSDGAVATDIRRGLEGAFQVFEPEAAALLPTSLCAAPVRLPRRRIGENAGSIDQSLARTFDRAERLRRRLRAPVLIWGEAGGATTPPRIWISVAGQPARGPIEWAGPEASAATRQRTAEALSLSLLSHARGLDQRALSDESLEQSLERSGAIEGVLRLDLLWSIGLMERTLGRQRGDLAAIERAVNAFAAAEAGWRDQDDPFALAIAQTNVALSLNELGELTQDPMVFDRAVEAFERALSSPILQAEGLKWAAAQQGLGVALRSVGFLRNDPSRLEAALGAYGRAIEAISREAAPMDWAALRINQGVAEYELGLVYEDETRLAAAIGHYRAGLEVYDEGGAPLERIRAQRDLAGALQVLGVMRDEEALLTEAVALARTALAATPEAAAPVEWATSQDSVGIVVYVLGAFRLDPDLIEEAIRAHEAARAVYAANGLAALADIAEANRDRARETRDLVLRARAQQDGG